MSRTPLHLVLLSAASVGCVAFLTTGCGAGTEHATFSFTIAWDAPTTSADGTSLDDLAGYRVYDGTAPGRYSSVTDVGRATQATFEEPAAGTYYFAVTAYDRSGNESNYSEELSLSIGP